MLEAELKKQKKTRPKLDAHVRSNALQVDGDLETPIHIQKFTVTSGKKNVNLQKMIHCPACLSNTAPDTAYEVTYKMIIKDKEIRRRVRLQAGKQEGLEAKEAHKERMGQIRSCRRNAVIATDPMSFK